MYPYRNLPSDDRGPPAGTIDAHRSREREDLMYPAFDVNYTDESGYSHFHAACQFSCEEAVRRFLESGQDPNCIWTETGDSVLHIAVISEEPGNNIVEPLLRAGADPNVANKEGLTPLHIIAREDWDCEMLERFLQINNELNQLVQINARDKLGNTPLHLAANEKKMFEGLLRTGADPNVANDEGSTPLHIICQKNINCCDEFAESFLKINDELNQRVLIEARDKLHRTPLQCAVTKTVKKKPGSGGTSTASSGTGKEQRLMEVVLKKDTSMGGKLTPSAFARNQKFEYVLHTFYHQPPSKCYINLCSASSQGLIRSTQAAADSVSTSRKIPVPSSGKIFSTRLLATGQYHEVYYFTARERISFFFSKPHKFDVNYTDESGYSHFHAACQFSCEEAVRRFLESGQDPNCIWTETGDSVLHIAVISEEPGNNIVEPLLRAGADPNVANKEGLTPLHIIAREDWDCEMLERFLQINNELNQLVQINARDKLGNTPLHLAANEKKMFEGLLRTGADPNVANDEGSTPLHIICQKNINCCDEFAESFLKINDELNQRVLIEARDKLHRTPLQCAVVYCLPYAEFAESWRRSVELRTSHFETVRQAFQVDTSTRRKDLVWITMWPSSRHRETREKGIRAEPKRRHDDYEIIRQTKTVKKKPGSGGTSTASSGTGKEQRLMEVVLKKDTSMGGKLTPSAFARNQKFEYVLHTFYHQPPSKCYINLCSASSQGLIRSTQAAADSVSTSRKIPVPSSGKIFSTRLLATGQYHEVYYFTARERISFFFSKPHKFDVNYTDESGYSHFHAACQFSCEEAVRRFLESGQDPNCIWTETGDSVLHIAVISEEPGNNIVEPLLRAGADPNVANKEGLTPLHIIAREDWDCEMLERFLQINNELNQLVQINARDKLGNTPLHLAANEKKMFEGLLRTGADPNVANDEGSTPLHIICQKNINCCDEFAESFLKINDELNQRVLIEARDKLHRTPLQCAVTKTVKKKPGSGGTSTASSGTGKEQRLMEVVLKKDTSMGGKLTPSAFARNQKFEYVLHTFYHQPPSKCYINLCSASSQGLIRSTQAAADSVSTSRKIPVPSSGKIFSTRLLATGQYHEVYYFTARERISFFFSKPHKFDVNYTDESGYSHFHAACQFSCEEAVRRFLESGQDPNCIWTETGDSVLHIAVISEEPGNNIVEPLLRAGADPNVANKEGLTPLHIIAREDWDCEMLERFLQINNELNQLVQINARDKLGNTPLHLAANEKKMFEGLLRTGADPNVANDEGSTPLHIICQKNINCCDEFAESFLKINDELNQRVLIEARDKLHRTPLQCAVCTNYFRTSVFGVSGIDAVSTAFDGGRVKKRYLNGRQAHAFSFCPKPKIRNESNKKKLNNISLHHEVKKLLRKEKPQVQKKFLKDAAKFLEDTRKKIE
ncbi:unnamed protein product [Trichogramma brassicae]|uniref:Uncharacterized protein n=1 Tax=Trichogramma brassicae TaxID=86971 RepID=A0A6H5J3B0_9HYME|nr:unnamed protein product [Trichogramma brassicae]